MQLVVDAWNVLHVEGLLPPGLAGLDLMGLERLIGASRWAQARVHLVCDGRPEGRPEGPLGAAQVHWSGQQREADDLIEHLIKTAPDPRRMFIISSDRRLRQAARKRRCRWLSSTAFLRSILEDLARGAASPPTLIPDDEDWYATFGVEEGLVASLEAELATPSESREPMPTSEEDDQACSPNMSQLDQFPDHVLAEARRIAKG